jgi:hypothetical protein
MKYIIIVVFDNYKYFAAQSLYEMPANPQSRLSSFENPNGIKRKRRKKQIKLPKATHLKIWSRAKQKNSWI